MRLSALTRSFATLAGLSLVTCGGSDPFAFGGSCEDNPRQEVVNLVNQIRASNGLQPLAIDVRLAYSAQTHTEDMTDGDFLSHTGSNGSNPGQRITAAGYPWTGWSENVAAGQTTPQAVVDGWMNSQGHRDNILRATSQHIGVGYASVPGTTYTHYWTQNFGSSSSPPETGNGCHP